MTVAHDGLATRTLYLLDDNAEFRTTARWWLEGAGYRVMDFGDAAAALAALESQMQAGSLTDSCLLLDVRMPGMSGLQVHDALIARGIAGPQAQWPLPVVYMTGHGDVPLAVQAMEKAPSPFWKSRLKTVRWSRHWLGRLRPRQRHLAPLPAQSSFAGLPR